MAERGVIAFLAEAAAAIGTGHVVETGTLVREARGRGLETAVWINADTPPGLLEKLTGDIRIVPGFDWPQVERIASEVQALGARAIVTNLRRVSNEQVEVLMRGSFPVLCIDEWGNRELDCDVAVNPTPVAHYHRYTSRHPGFRLYAGVAYLALTPEYQRFHECERRPTGPLKSIAIAMGGVDRTGIAVHLADTVLAVRPDITVNVVIGAGFTHHRELHRLRASAPTGRVQIHQNLSTLADLLVRCDVGFTVGGNTLVEMACLGTPALVFYEELHEREQSEAMEDLGFGRCLGACVSLDRAAIGEALKALDDPRERARHSMAGKALVDGKGALRILDIVTGLFKDATYVMR